MDSAMFRRHMELVERHVLEGERRIARAGRAGATRSSVQSELRVHDGACIGYPCPQALQSASPTQGLTVTVPTVRSNRRDWT